jgi:hypothetical protein
MHAYFLLPLKLGTEILVPGFYLTCQPRYHQTGGGLTGELLFEAGRSPLVSRHSGKEIPFQNPGDPWARKGTDKQLG